MAGLPLLVSEDALGRLSGLLASVLFDLRSSGRSLASRWGVVERLRQPTARSAACMVHRAKPSLSTAFSRKHWDRAHFLDAAWDS